MFRAGALQPNEHPPRTQAPIDIPQVLQSAAITQLFNAGIAFVVATAGGNATNLSPIFTTLLMRRNANFGLFTTPNTREHDIGRVFGVIASGLFSLGLISTLGVDSNTAMQLTVFLAGISYGASLLMERMQPAPAPALRI